MVSINNISIEDISDFIEVFNKIIDYSKSDNIDVSKKEKCIKAIQEIQYLSQLKPRCIDVGLITEVLGYVNRKLKVEIKDNKILISITEL